MPPLGEDGPLGRGEGGQGGVAELLGHHLLLLLLEYLEVLLIHCHHLHALL